MESEHHANFVPWQQVCKARGIKFKVVGVDSEGRLRVNELKKAIGKKTRLVAVGHMSNVTGAINDVSEIVKLAKSVRARVLVDGAQSVQHLGVDVKELGCDFLVMAGHKMMGPMGIGGLYIKREVQNEVGVYKTGGGMISEVYGNRSVWVKGVEKWEAGTPNVAGAVGLAAAVEYMRSVGVDKIWKHEKKLTEYALTRFKNIDSRFKIRIIGPEDMENRGGVICFVVRGVHAHDVAQILDSEGVAVRSGHHCAMPLHQKFKIPASVRVSFGVYNTKLDIDRLIKGLEKVKGVFK